MNCGFPPHCVSNTCGIKHGVLGQLLFLNGRRHILVVDELVLSKLCQEYINRTNAWRTHNARRNCVTYSGNLINPLDCRFPSPSTWMINMVFLDHCCSQMAIRALQPCYRTGYHISATAETLHFACAFGRHATAPPVRPLIVHQLWENFSPTSPALSA